MTPAFCFACRFSFLVFVLDILKIVFIFKKLQQSLSKAYTSTMSVTIHTTAGDLKCEIFCDTCPRTAFNFLALAAAGKYDKTIFHRNIRGFMIQGGDTAHVTGKKSSIWGDDVTFPDE